MYACMYSIYSLQYFGKYIDDYVAKNYGVKVANVDYIWAKCIDYWLQYKHYTCSYVYYAQVLDLKYVTFSKHMQKSSNYTLTLTM